MKEHEPCRRTADGTEIPSTPAARDAESSIVAPAVVSVGTRPVVEIGPPTKATWEEQVAADPTLLNPDAEWDRIDDYAMTGQRAYESDKEELRQANTETRLAHRGGARFS